MVEQQKEVYLTKRVEPLQIPYPKGFSGRKSGDPTDEEFMLNTSPRWLTTDEIELAQKFIKRLPYQQSLNFTGAVLIDKNDPLFQLSHSQLNELEKSNGFPCSHKATSGGVRSIEERVLIIREQGYQGGAATAFIKGGN